MTWHVPFRGRNASGRVDVNFLFQAGRTYVMDNHRLAPWCFWQHDQEADSWRLFHIDRHRDTADEGAPWPQLVETQHRNSVEAFLSASDGSREIYPYDVVVTAPLLAEPGRIGLVYMATRDDGWLPRHTEEVDPWSLQWKLWYIVEKNEEDKSDQRPWWVDLDLDYFTDLLHRPLIVDDQVRAIGRLLRRGLENGRIRLLTIALSPECTGDWTIAERLLDLVLESWPTDERPTLSFFDAEVSAGA